MSELWKFSTNKMNFEAQTKGTSKKSSAFKSFHSDKKTLVRKETGSLTNIKVYNGRSYCGIFDRSRCNYPIYCLDF